jgi:hypothetical protein
VTAPLMFLSVSGVVCEIAAMTYNLI